MCVQAQAAAAEQEIAAKAQLKVDYSFTEADAASAMAKLTHAAER